MYTCNDIIVRSQLLFVVSNWLHEFLPHLWFGLLRKKKFVAAYKLFRFLTNAFQCMHCMHLIQNIFLVLCLGIRKNSCIILSNGHNVVERDDLNEENRFCTFLICSWDYLNQFLSHIPFLRFKKFLTFTLIQSNR